jgi:hypothetical protein
VGVILSPDSVDSKWVKEELELALNNQIKEAQIRVIPILFRECALPGFLKGKKYVDFSTWNRSKKRKNSYELLGRAIEQVVKAVGVDPTDARKWSGRKMIKVCDFKFRISEHFAPSIVTVQFFEDESGLNFIKVDNGDSTFQLYEPLVPHTRPVWPLSRRCCRLRRWAWWRGADPLSRDTGSNRRMSPFRVFGIPNSSRVGNFEGTPF